MRRYVGVLGLVLGLLVACSGPPAGLRLNPDEATVEPDGELRITFSGASADDLVWTARHGTLEVDEDGVLYRAPDYAVNDVVEAVRANDPRERAQVRIRVRSSGTLTPRIRVSSDQALLFTEAGEERVLSVVVYDAQGRPDPDAAVRFSSEDPERVAVERTGPRQARVRALTREVGTVPVRIRTEAAEARAWAVVAEAQPQAVRIDPEWILQARWDPDALAWSELTLARVPGSEILEAGRALFSGDRVGIWGRIRSVRVEGERLRLELDPATLTDVFKNLDYVVHPPAFPVDLDSAAAGRLRLSGPAGTERLVAPATCDGANAESSLRGTVRAALRGEVRIRNGRLLRAHWRLDLEGELRHGPVVVHTAESGAPCTWLTWEADLPPVSALLFPLPLRLSGTLELRTNEGAPPATLTLPPWRSTFQAERGWEVSETGVTEPKLSDKATPELAGAEPGLHFDDPGEASLTLSETVELQARVGARGQLLTEGRPLSWRQALALTAALEGPLDPADAAYRGPDWRLDWSRAPAAGARLDALLGALLGVAPPRPPEPERTRAQTLARAPRVWGHLDTGGVRRIDLGEVENDPAARFNFESAPPASGQVEVWLRGGACTDAGGCFTGPLKRVAAVSFPDGPLFWRPRKDERGVYQVFLRYRLGTAGQDHPYAARPPDPRIVVEGPDLQELPLSVTLRGAPGATAVGVLRYRNVPLAGVRPDGTPVQLTSTLQVWTPVEGLLSAAPRQLALVAGRWGYHRLTATCPKTPGTLETELPLYSNDPELPEVTLPAVLVCGGAAVAEPELEVEPRAGAAPLKARFRLKPHASGNAELHCRLDFGDGSPPQTWPAGACPAEAALEHVYARPGLYQATLLVSAAGEPLNLAFVFVRAD